MERFWERVRKDDSGCWVWIGARHGTGYGGFTVRGRQTTTAHRFAYETLVGPVPDGMTIDHLCRNRICCNPEHLEVVTYSENNQRSWDIRPRRAACPKGHLYTPENVYYQGTSRSCLTCRRARGREYWRRRSATWVSR